MAFKTKKGFTLLNPSEKSTKMLDELRNDCRLTNDNYIKTDSFGRPIKLTNTQKAYRSGYLAARKDSARAFKSNNPNYKRKTK